MAGLAIATILGAGGWDAARASPPPQPAPAIVPGHSVVSAPSLVVDGGARPAAAPGGFEATLLPRHGLRPLAFRGRLLVQAGMEAAISLRSHVALYETDRGGIVAAIRHAPADADLPDLTYAAAFADCESLKSWLGGHDPLADVPIEVLLPKATRNGHDPCPDADHLVHAGEEGGRIRARFHALLAALLAPCNDPSTKGLSP